METAHFKAGRQSFVLRGKQVSLLADPQAHNRTIELYAECVN
jgi:hypothetical protein